MSLKAAAERELYERLTQALEKYKGKRGVLIAALQEQQMATCPSNDSRVG